MAEFPSNPANGDKHTIGAKTWEYNATTDKWSIDLFGLDDWTISQDASDRLLFLGKYKCTCRKAGTRSMVVIHYSGYKYDSTI